MAQLMAMIDATKIDPTQGLPALPVGKHPVVITESEVKAVKSGDGGMVEFTLQIIDGPAKGSHGAYRLNLYNSNPQSVEIAHKQMSALCHVLGVYQVNDTQQLHNRPFIVEVGLQKGEEAKEKGYTEVKRVFDINGHEPGKQGQAGQPAQTAPVGGSPWGGQPPANTAPPTTQQPPQTGQPPAPWGGGNANTGGAQWSAPPGATVGQPPSNAAPPQSAGPTWGNQQPPQQTQQAGNSSGGQQPPWARS